MTGTRILVAMVDSTQRMVLKAVLTRKTYQCAVCNNMKDLAGMFKQCQKKSQGWNYDVIFVEYSPADYGKEYADLSIIETIRRLEAMEDLRGTKTICSHSISWALLQRTAQQTRRRALWRA